MNFNPKDEFDFLKNQEFVQWVNHQREKDTEMWHIWLQKNSDKTEYFHKAKAIINSFQYLGDEKIDDSRLGSIREKLLEEFDHQLKTRPIPQKRTALSRLKTFKWAAAASITLILAIGAILYTADRKSASESMVRISTERGERKNVMLPDGSSVMLDSHTSIAYLKDFTGGRKVNLSGRAFFEVTKQNGQPFDVLSELFEVKVIGTSFDMNTDPTRGNGHVALVTGKVDVKMEKGEEIGLAPDDAAFFDFTTNKISKGNFDKDQILGWRENILKFKDEPYPIVFERISNWYGIEFIYGKNLDLEGLYSATYKDQKLEDVLQGLSYASDLQFKIMSGKVHVLE